MCKKRKELSTGLVLLMLTIALVLAGCKQATETPMVEEPVVEEPTEAKPPAQEPTEVEPTEVEPLEDITLVLVNHLTHEPWRVAMDEAFATYTEVQPNVTIDQQPTPSDELSARVMADRMMDDPPDVYFLPAWWLGKLVEADIPAVPPDDIVADIEANFPNGSIQAVTYDGQIWGMPQDNNPTVMIYNIAALQDAGYDGPPQTFEQMLDYARTLTTVDADGNTIYGYSQFSGGMNYSFQPFASQLYSCGGEIFDSETGLSAFNSEQGVYILEKWLELSEDGAFNYELTAQDWLSGRIAMTLLPNWVHVYLATYGDPSLYASAPVPPCEGYETGALGYSYITIVNSRSEHQEAAWDFLRWFFDPQGAGDMSLQARMQFDLAGVFPGRTSDMEALSDEYDTPFFEAYVAALDYAKAPTPHPAYEEIIHIFITELENAVFGMKTVQEALDDAAAQADALIQAP